MAFEPTWPLCDVPARTGSGVPGEVPREEKPKRAGRRKGPAHLTGRSFSFCPKTPPPVNPEAGDGALSVLFSPPFAHEGRPKNPGFLKLPLTEEWIFCKEIHKHFFELNPPACREKNGPAFSLVERPK